MRFVVAILCVIFSFGLIKAQELNVDVRILTPNLTKADPKIFRTLERTITEFLNEQKWTDDEYEEHERISANLQITIREEFSTNSFSADFVIQSVRPVFRSGYSTQLINYLDNNIRFDYEEFQPIQPSQNNFFDNLSSVLTYYALVIIGMDYDSFSPFGGDPYYQLAQTIVAAIPPNVAAKDPGWIASGNRFNRFTLIDNLLNPRIREIRQAIYDYHRKSLDIMGADVSKGRAIMLSALKSIGDVHRSFPGSMIVQMFSDSKGNEILEIFKQADRSTQKRVYGILTTLDPSKASNYKDLK